MKPLSSEARRLASPPPRLAFLTVGWPAVLAAVLLSACAGGMAPGAGTTTGGPAVAATDASGNREASPQNPFPNPPQAAAPRPLQIAAPEEAVLPNGLRVVVAERHDLPLVTVQLLVHTGAEADPPRSAGLASLTAGLLTRGTRRQSAPVQAAAAESLGGTLVSAAGWNRSTVSITVTTPRLGAALALVAEAATAPAFARSELDRLRSETLDEMKVAYTRPGTLASLAANRMLFGSGGYGHPVAGTPATLPHITVREVQLMHRRYFRPDNAALVLTGDIDQAQAMRLVRQHFGQWKAPRGPLPAPRPAAAKPEAAPLQFVKMGDTGQAGVAMALLLPAAGSADEAAGEVANAVLGGGYSSRLNEEIRVKRGLSYGAGSAFDARPQAGVLRVAVQTKNASAAEVVSLMNSALDRMADTAVSDAELGARKATLIGGFSRSVETTEGLAAQLSKLLVEGRPVAQLTTRIDTWEAVGGDAVQAFAKAHFEPGNRHTAVAGNLADFAPGFAAMHKPGDAAPPTLDAAALQQLPSGATK